MDKLKRAWRRMVAWFFVPGLLLAAGCAMAPPERASVITEIEAANLVDDLAAIRAAKATTDAKFAELWGDENGKRIKAAYDAKIAALVATAAAENRPVTPQEISALIDQRDATKAKAAARIGATLAAADDPNFAVAEERARLLLDYVSQITERDREAARLRKAIGLNLKPPTAPPVIPEPEDPQ